MNDAITWTSIGILVGILSPVIGAVWYIWYTLYQKIENVSRDASIKFTATAAVIADFKLEVARNYATNSSIREVEERVVQAIERLGDRLDKFLDGRPRPRS